MLYGSFTFTLFKQYAQHAHMHLEFSKIVRTHWYVCCSSFVGDFDSHILTMQPPKVSMQFYSSSG